MANKIKVNVFAEKFIKTANGVTTAFLETIEKLRQSPEIDLLVNGKEPYDILHSHTIGLKFFKESFKKKHKTVLTAHVVPDSFLGSLIFSRAWYPLAKLYLKFIYNRARTIIAVSPTVKTELAKIGVKADLQVVCNSVDRAKFKPDLEKRKELRKKYNINLDQKLVIGVGQIQPRKGILDFIETALQVPDAKFMWVGGKPYGRLTQDYEQMESLVKNAPQNVIFTGIVDYQEMPAYYASSDIYFLPSFQENFAFATIEAASSNLPLVMRDNQEYTDTLFDCYLKADKSFDFAKIIKQLCLDELYLQEWQNKSSRLADMYTSEVWLAKIIEIYQKIINE